MVHGLLQLTTQKYIFVQSIYIRNLTADSCMKRCHAKRSQMKKEYIDVTISRQDNQDKTKNVNAGNTVYAD